MKCDRLMSPITCHISSEYAICMPWIWPHQWTILNWLLPERVRIRLHLYSDIKFQSIFVHLHNISCAVVMRMSWVGRVCVSTSARLTLNQTSEVNVQNKPTQSSSVKTSTQSMILYKFTASTVINCEAFVCFKRVHWSTGFFLFRRKITVRLNRTIHNQIWNWDFNWSNLEKYGICFINSEWIFAPHCNARKRKNIFIKIAIYLNQIAVPMQEWFNHFPD